jgi:hypothetical protein
VLSDLSDCSDQERALVEEYPHYGDRRIATYPWTFSCSVRYTTNASTKKILGYYNELLRQEGWEVMGAKPCPGEVTYPANSCRTHGVFHNRLAASLLLVETAIATGSATSLPTRETRTSQTTRPS